MTPLSTTILTMAAPSGSIRCRLLVGGSGSYKAFDVSVSYGTQGLVCTLWERF